ncbi:hypothetical protein SAMN02910264_00832 [Ruminococcaceae bacterium YAD3003]|nr:hypothetical protein SAMN02910264_00832 [Ruminococcaceae bacterium YAD3003]
MAMKERPVVSECAGGRCWENTFDSFTLKVFVPDNDLDGQTNNYGFRAPLLLVFEEEKQSIEDAVNFAHSTGLADIAAKYDSSVLFIYPNAEGGWGAADSSLYADVIAEIKLIQVYKDGIVEDFNFFTQTFEGYFVRGAKFRTDIYSYGKSADYVAENLLKTIEGEYLWGPGEITPAMCSMENLSVVPDIKRKDIAILSVGNSDEINLAFSGCKNILFKEKADYVKDYDSFVKKFKMWCGVIEFEPDFTELGITEDVGFVNVKTSPDNDFLPEKKPEHKVGYFAYYNKELLGNGPVPLVIGFHGGGDSSMYLTYVAGWWEVAHKYDFLYVAIENHQFVTATEARDIIEVLKTRYPIDESRIYATGFSMGSGKTWDLYQEYPEILAGIMPCSALFPVYTTFFGKPVTDRLNKTVSVPVFYSGGEKSHLPELPFQGEACVERVKYVAEVNKLKKSFADVDFENKDNWENPVWGIPGDRVDTFYDETRDATLTVNYFDSEDGVCRTAFAGVSNQIHECREHSIETAWKFISQFRKEN